MSVLMKIKIPTKGKKPLWAKKILKEAENFAAPDGTFKKSKRPHKLTYNALMNEILNFEKCR